MTTEHQENDYVVHSGEELNLPKTFPKVEISKSIKKVWNLMRSQFAN